jgi:hypothetical protein
VTEGAIVRVPDAPTIPTPWSIETDVAPVVDQFNEADWPDEIVVGLAVRLAVGGETATKVILALFFTDPALLLAVSV